MARITMAEALGTPTNNDSSAISVAGGPQPNKSNKVEAPAIKINSELLAREAKRYAEEQKQKQAVVMPETEPQLQSPAPSPNETVDQQVDSVPAQVAQLEDSYAQNVADAAYSGKYLTDAEIDAMLSKGEIGFIETLRRTKIASYVPFAGTIADAVSIGKMYDLARKQNAGEQLTAVEQQMLKDYARDQIEFQIRGRSIGGTIAEMLPDTIAFMGELGAAAAVSSTGVGAAAGLASGAKTLAKVGGKNAVKKVVKKSIMANVGKAAATAAGTAALMPQQIYKNYNNRKVYGSLDITDKGEVVFQDMLEKPVTTFFKAYGDVFVEVLSESSGRIISKGINKATSPLFNKAKGMVPARFVETFNKLSQQVNPQNGITRFIKDKAMFDGVLAEMGEERLGDLLRIGFGLDDSQMDTTDKIANAIFPGTDQLLAELGLFSVIGTASMGTAKAYDMLKQKAGDIKAADMVSVMTEQQKDKMAEGDIEDVTPNMHDKVKKENPGAVKISEAKKSSLKNLDQAYSIARAKKVLEKGKRAAELQGRKKDLNPLQYAKEFVSTYFSWNTPWFQKNFVDLRSAAKLNPEMATYLSIANSIPQTASAMFDFGVSYRLPDNYSAEIEQNIKPMSTMLADMQHEAGNSRDFDKDYEAFQEIGALESELSKAATRTGYRPYDSVNNLTKRREEIKQELGARAKARGREGTEQELGEMEYARLLGHVKTVSDTLKALNLGSAYEGVLSVDRADMLNRNNPIMWPSRMERDISDITAADSKKSFLRKSVHSDLEFQESKGAGKDSTARRVDVLEQVMNAMQMHLTRRLNKRIETELIKIAQSGELKGFVDIAKTSADKKAEGIKGEKSDLTEDFGEKKNVFPVNVNGETVNLVLSRDITEALQADIEPSSFIRGMKMITNIFRAGVTTLRASFVVGNLVRDTQVAAIQSGNKQFIPGIDTARGAAQVAGRTETFKSFARSGALGSDILTFGRSFSPASYIKGIAERTQKFSYFSPAGLAVRLIKAPFKAIMRINELAELGTRVGVYGRNINWESKALRDEYPLPSAIEVEQQALSREVQAYDLWLLYIRKRAQSKVVSDLKNEALVLKGKLEATNDPKYKQQLDELNSDIAKLEAKADKTEKEFNEKYKKYGLDRVGKFQELKEVVDGERTLDFNSDANSVFPEVQFNQGSYIDNALALTRHIEALRNKSQSELDRVNKVIPTKEHALFQRMKEKLDNLPQNTQFEKIMASPYKFQVFKAAQDLGMSMEQAAEQAGTDGLSAVFMARNSTTDFGTMGAFMRDINALFPFSNAALQSALTMARSFKNNPVATSLRAMVLSLPGVASAVYYLMFGTEEDRREFLSFPEYEHDTYMHLKINGVWYKLPLPFEYGLFFGSLPKKFLMQFYKANPKEAGSFIMDSIIPVFSMLSPVDPSVPLPQPAMPIAEYLANYNFWKGRSIVPEYQEKMEPFKQYSHATSTTLIKLAEEMDKLFGTSFSPAKMENFLNGMFGGFAGDVLGAVDRGFAEIEEKKTGVAPLPVELSDLPILDRFISSSGTGYRSAQVQDLMKEYKKMEQVVNTYHNMLATDDPRADSYYEANEEEFAKINTLTEANGYIKHLGQEIVRIKEAAGWTAEEKAKAIKQNEKEMRDYADETLRYIFGTEDKK